MHIAIAGNIGSGKTTLTKLLAKHFNWAPVYENTDNNPYLTSFYDDMQRWSFNIQMFFLNLRCRQIIELQKKKKTIVQDRTIYEDAYIFAKNLHEMGLMANRDYNNYMSLFELMNSFIAAPDLLIYIRAGIPTLVSQIQKRGRKYETSIRLNYLENLNEKYEVWANSYTQGKMLIINADEKKFAENSDDLGYVIEKINAELYGLFK
ncbi:MAG: deoxynucleoside kinase [Bacteroidales bacterium]|jgi:deoxyadenosine/deoxycytidine kinase|nr:deoxynucleoside kinase [Bacteroidales bacterium]